MSPTPGALVPIFERSVSEGLTRLLAPNVIRELKNEKPKPGSLT